jgi:hypothetical protein
MTSAAIAAMLAVTGVTTPMAAGVTPTASPSLDCETLRKTDHPRYEAECVTRHVPAAPSESLSSKGGVYVVPCLPIEWLPRDAPKWSSVIVAGGCIN